MQPSPQTSEHPHAGVALLLAMTMALAPLALDTYLPAFPAMAGSLGTHVHQIGLSISVYVFMLASGQLVGGPLSDRLGRPVIMLSGLTLFALSSLLISLVQSLDALLALRALQAFGGGWAMVCVPALVRDRLSGVEAARFFSLIGLIMMAAPALAPTLGSLLLSLFSWHSIFVFLGLYATALIVLLPLVVFERRRAGPQPPSQQPAVSAWQRYRMVFATRPALRFMWLQTAAFSIMLLFITHSSFIYQQHFGAGPAAFALLFGANIALMLVFNLSNRWLLGRIAPQQMLRAAITLQAVGIALLLLVVTLAPTLWLFLPAMMLTIGAMGAIGPNTQACFMEFFAVNSGTAAALLGATQFLLAGLVSAASILLPETLLAIVLSQALCSVVCLWLIWKR